MAEYDRSATGPLPVDAGPRRAENIFDMSPEDFRASLGELQALGHDTDALMRQYRARNSPFAPINNAAEAQAQGLADSGRRPVLGGLLSKPEGATGLDAIMGLEREGWRGLLGAGQQVGQAIDAPAAIFQGVVPESDRISEAVNVAGVTMGAGGASAGRGLLDYDPNTTRIFGGPKAQNADLGAMATARELLDIGEDAATVWRETGWMQGPDGQMRFEIDDRNIGLRTPADAEGIGGAMRDDARGILDGISERNTALKTQPDLFPTELRRANGDLRRTATAMRDEAGSNYGPEWSHQTLGQRAQYAVAGDLDQAYPELMRDIIVRSDQRMGGGSRGSYNSNNNSLELSNNLQSDDARRSTLLHELQHGIQTNEGFAGGGNQSIARGVQSQANADIGPLNERLANISNARAAAWDADNFDGVIAAEDEYRKVMAQREALSETATSDPFDIYQRYAGEVESRNVQERRNMTPEERRASPPWTTQDTPNESQILRFDTTAANASQSGGLLGAGLSEAQRQARDILDMRAAGNARSVTDDMMGRADDQYMFDNTPLPMDEASRLARADAGGFDTGTPLYHGTAQDFPAFDDRKAGTNDGGLWGRGHYLSTSQGTANSYALREGDGALLMPSIARTDNLMPVTTGQDLITRLPDGTNTRDLTGPNLDGARIKDIALESGNDGVAQFKPDGNIGDIVTFEPTNIRSRFARFDPEFSHLSNLSAANASPTAGLLASGAQEQDKPLPFMEMLRGLLR
jgi:hypothetical protein